MGITRFDLDDGSMEDINEEPTPSDEEPTPSDQDPTLTDAPVPPVGPSSGPVAQADRLTRDPYATLGGVLSGIAHRYGWDVSLTRLAFVVLFILSGGLATIVYLLSWLIIPRASHWPPMPVNGPRMSLSGRDIGLGLVGLAALVVLGSGGGGTAAVLVPLALVGGGIWMLTQNPRPDEGQATAAPVATTGMVPYTPPPVHVPQPVEKRSRKRRFGILAVLGLLAGGVLLVIAVPLIILAAVTDGDLNFSTDTILISPDTIDEIPDRIVEDAGEIKLDLRDVDFSDYSGEPLNVRIDLDVGRIEVLLPQDLRVSVDAETDIGDVKVLGSTSDGFGPSLSVSDDDPQLDLDIDLNLGEIEVHR